MNDAFKTAEMMAATGASALRIIELWRTTLAETKRRELYIDNLELGIAQLWTIIRDAAAQGSATARSESGRLLGGLAPGFPPCAAAPPRESINDKEY